ncbi:T9SS type A sorting domain-containing protein [Chishuiella sp.]|uniref:T9SS type A sorting domain-containing protein n=1 Tax=Chishuiella sp. TaxID=1969467 RepID=UPI0028A7DA86|nr:T9SS type A sorting domain-containing protein [Chishuiella sp.]
MNKKILLFITLFIFSNSYGQLKPIAQKIEKSKIMSRNSKAYDIFSEEIQKKGKQYQNFAKNVSQFNLKKNEFSKLYSSKPNSLSLKVPFNGQLIDILLIKNDDLLTNNFKAINQDNQLIDYKPGLYYHGIINGDTSSLVAISIFENEIMGVASSDKLGDIIIGKLKNSENYISYSSYDLKEKQPINCSFDLLENNINSNSSFSKKDFKKDDIEMTKFCVRPFFEIAYNIYEKNDSDETKTLNWITGIFNNVQTLYSNDYIKTALGEVMIWEKEDPYGDNNDMVAYWYAYQKARPTFDGDFAMLLKLPYNTSLGYLNSLCTTNNYAYAFVDINYENFPTYSHTVTVIAHEMGHVLGSPHTQSCSWNGNNTALEGCSAPEGDCPLGPIPYETGGTIMGYCSNIPGVGINLSNGFGEQPAALIRKTVNSKSCLTTDCSMTCQYSIDSVNTLVDNNKVIFTISDAIGKKWKYNFYKTGQNKNEWKETSSKIITINNLDLNSYYTIEISNECTENSASRSFVSNIDTYSNYCNGDFFYDTGGADNDYSSNENIIKTFYPKKTEEKVTLTFLEFDIQPALEYEGNTYPIDYMNIYNGDKVDETKIFENGKQLNGNKIPGPFISTDKTGAITTEFSSDAEIQAKGWKAKIDCGNLGLNDYNSVDFNVYPNPTSNFINITDKELIQEYQLLTIDGKILILKNNLNLKNLKIDLEHFPKGIYLLKVKINNKFHTKKITKK